MGASNIAQNADLNLSAISQTAALVMDLKKKKLKVKRSKIRDVSTGLAEIALNIGDTNDPEEYASLLEEDIWEGLKLAEERRRIKQKQQRPS